jgi:hypothetical protein
MPFSAWRCRFDSRPEFEVIGDRQAVPRPVSRCLVEIAPGSGPRLQLALFALGYLKVAVALTADISGDVRMHLGCANGHQSPILRIKLRGKALSVDDRYPQCRIRFFAIDVILGFNGCPHRSMIPATSLIAIDFGI